ncbi:efflux RND transporter periplasmic adaptor subunit [Sphingomonas qomolangmaensis]|uniref:Efflux RND transporter periplasmic adaptor subunit n=1 Tax=Sphingomonas qomolangmaensis TaxID=2918765 RepID=A0ABY5L638_9SPHN|nr:efflux RND transporter periplasmic adaptor subunit [Sphingomonas qomolangmaensis]UUL82242.1 efflux RND transporter periplasmic adaptor subunit [Sphingomonas qomolangmaensis]
MHRKIACLAPVLCLLAACGGGGDDEASAKAKGKGGTPEVGVVTLQAEQVPLTTELAGRAAAFETSDVRPQVSGVIKARLFTEGSIVRQGQTLYQVDPSIYRAAVAEAEANLANAQANLTAQSARADRFRPLAEIEAVSKQEYTDAQAAARQAAASVQQQRALLETARINLRFTNVPAPITGRIGRSIATTGALVTANQAEALTMIQRLDPIFIDIQQSSADLLALRRALATDNTIPSTAEVRLRLEDGSDYGQVGTLQFAEAMVDPETGAVTLRARFPNPQGLLLPGMYVRARFSQATARRAILVPQAGISRDPRGNATVLIVGPDNKAVRRNVRAEQTVGDKWLVTGGVRAGDRVIVEGLARAQPGQTVRPVPAGSAPRQRPATQGGAQGATKAGN